MKCLRATIVAMSLVPAAVLNPGAAWSSACNEEKVVEIHMTAGEVCGTIAAMRPRSGGISPVDRMSKYECLANPRNMTPPPRRTSCCGKRAQSHSRRTGNIFRRSQGGQRNLDFPHASERYLSHRFLSMCDVGRKRRGAYLHEMMFARNDGKSSPRPSSHGG
jgi:hypothetical protein